MLDEFFFLLELLVDHGFDFSSTDSLGFGLFTSVESERKGHGNTVLALFPLTDLCIVSSADPARELVSAARPHWLSVPHKVVLAVIVATTTVEVFFIIILSVIFRVLVFVIASLIFSSFIFEPEIEFYPWIIIIILPFLISVKVLMFSQILIQAGFPTLLDVLSASE